MVGYHPDLGEAPSPRAHQPVCTPPCAACSLLSHCGLRLVFTLMTERVLRVAATDGFAAAFGNWLGLLQQSRATGVRLIAEGAEVDDVYDPWDEGQERVQQRGGGQQPSFTIPAAWSSVKVVCKEGAGCEQLEECMVDRFKLMGKPPPSSSHVHRVRYPAGAPVAQFIQAIAQEMQWGRQFTVCVVQRVAAGGGVSERARDEAAALVAGPAPDGAPLPEAFTFAVVRSGCDVIDVTAAAHACMHAVTCHYFDTGYA